MLRHYDVTYLFTDPNEICTAYVKLNSKHILFVRIFWIFDLFFEINTIIVLHIYSHIYIYIYLYYILHIYLYIYIYTQHDRGVHRS